MGKKERKGRVGGKESSKINRNGTCCSLLRIYKWEGKHFKRWERYANYTYMYVCAIATGV